MIWILFAVTAGVATWAAMGMRSGAVERRRGQPLLWGAGATAAVLLALGTYVEVQEQRTMAQIMDRTDDLLDRGMARTDVRRAEFHARRDEFDRRFRDREDAFDRDFKAQGDRFDRALDEHRAAMKDMRRPSATRPAPASTEPVR